MATDFDQTAARYGRSSLEDIRRVLSAMPTSPFPSDPIDEQLDEIRCGEEFTLADDSLVSVTLDCERFYCTELLFSPSALESCASSPGLSKMAFECVQAVDQSVRGAVCSTVLLTGRTALLPGLQKRLEGELAGYLRPLGVPGVEVLIAEGADWPPSSAWNGISVKLQGIYCQDPTADDDLDVFVQNVVSAQEYFDIGPAVLNRSRFI